MSIALSILYLLSGGSKSAGGTSPIGQRAKQLSRRQTECPSMKISLA
jgi:hypothetical protein